MKSLLFIGGPLIATIGFGFYSGLLDFAHTIDGLEYEAGVAQLETAQVPRVGTEFTETIELELETEPIEYREGDEITTVRKQPGFVKYTDIVMRRPSGFDWKSLRFIFEPQCLDCATPTQPPFEEGEMIQIDPPKTVIPLR